MNKQVTNITSMVETAEEERQARLKRYLLTMAFRTACVILMVFVRGPLLWVVAFCAIFLPWIAVTVANHARERKRVPIERPEDAPVVVYRPPVRAEDWAQAMNTSNKTASASTHEPPSAREAGSARSRKS